MRKGKQEVLTNVSLLLHHISFNRGPSTSFHITLLSDRLHVTDHDSVSHMLNVILFKPLSDVSR